MPVHFPFDFREPDYAAVLQHRAARLERLREDPELLAAMFTFYRDNPAQFIIDWGVTTDPRNVEKNRPAQVPFILFPKQEEWVGWLVDNWRTGRPGLTEKTRDMGMSWLSVAVACTLCLFNPGLAIGFGSRKQEYVDLIGSPKSLFEKARMFLQLLPVEFRGGWSRDKHAPHMRLMFPDAGSVITGEAGDGIGRGDRASIYFVDEAAFLERPQLVDASLSATTNCRQDISTPNGPANPFAQKRFGGKIPVFTFSWRDDPRKDDAWYAYQCDILDPVTVAQELDINYSASLEGVMIPAVWVQAAVNAHVKLGFGISGELRGALDVADQGSDKNALILGRGVVIQSAEAWSGKESDIFATVERAFTTCDINGLTAFDYDSDGLGAGVRGDARVLNDQRAELGVHSVEATPWRGSGAVVNKEDPIPNARGDVARDAIERTNGDFFENAKAQAWWELRVRFQRTYRAVRGELEGWRPEDLISLCDGYEAFGQLMSELSQVTYSKNKLGKIVVDKQPPGTRSPNVADGVVMRMAPRERVVAQVGVLMPRRFAK